MALIDKYANFNLAMLMELAQGMPIAKLRLVLRFAGFLVETQAPGKG